MFKKEYLSNYVKYGTISAVLYCIPLVMFVTGANYHKTWLLFLGNFLFLIGILAYLLSFSKVKNENASTQTMTTAGHLTTVFGIILSCIVAVMAVLFFSPANTGDVMSAAPAQTGDGATHGLVFFVFMSAIIGNFCGGSFISIIIPYTAKRNQTKDKKSEVLNN